VQPSRDISRLLEIMAALRTPVTGCPWDLEQDFSTIAPYTIEEAYEVADAIERGDLDELRDELGDLLLQVVFHARMAEERGLFAFGDVVDAITTKLIRRHPHVFGDARELTPAAVKGLWDKIKAVATKIYGAADVTADAKVRAQIKKLQEDGYGQYPVCVAKTQYSFSTDPQLRGAPSGHMINIREVRLAAGAEFIVMVCGDVMTMPGLPKVPSAEKIDLTEDGKVVGLF